MLLLSLAMEPKEDAWMEDQWEKWLTHDLSLDEFEDEDLSQVTEIRDKCGVSLNYDELDSRDHVTWPASSEEAGKAERRGAREEEMLHLDLIDAEEEIVEEEEHWGLIHGADHRLDDQEEEATVLPVKPPPVNKSAPAPVAMDTYRPKRPTTLALFPQVPRTQDTINNNSFGKKDKWKDSHSSSPHITGDLTPTQDRVSHNDEKDKVQQHSGSSVGKHRGTLPDKAHKNRDKDRDRDTSLTHGATHTRDKPSAAPHNDSSTVQPGRRGSMRDTAVDGRGGRGHGRGRHREDDRPEATEEIFLTPVQKNPDRERSFLSQSSDGNRMSISSDAEGPPPLQPTLPDRTNPSISEEDEVYAPAPPPVFTSTSTSSSRFTVPKGGGGGTRVRATQPGCQGEAGEAGESGALRTAQSNEATGLTYDSVKYTLVVDEHAKLELVSLKQCYQSYSDDSDTETVYESANEDEEDYEVDRSKMKRASSSRLSKVSSSEDGGHRSRKFLNIFVNGHHRSSVAESFGLFSCVLDGVEREQSHRAVFRFIPRHDDELELEVDDPLLMEAQSDDLWCKAYNMRTGTSGIFPAYYVIKVSKEHVKDKNDDRVEKFRVKFLGSVHVPYHKGNDVLCAAMQKIATNKRMTMQPPSACILEINMKGVKIIVQDECRTSERGDKCFHFFQLKNISFCGCHPKHNKYFGFITKHPDHQRFACHVFMSDDSTPLAVAVGKAFQQYYKEHVGYSCPTEDIFLE